MGNISRNTSKSIAVYFDPLMCTKSAEISCQVNFRDAHGSRGSVFMEPKLIIVVCPIINTDHDINVGRLKEFIEKLPNRDSKIYEVQHGFDVSKLASIARVVLEKHDVRHVRTLETKDGREWEIWYYGRTKVTKADIVMKVSISSEKHLVELFAATETAEALTGLLAEFGRDLKSSIESLSSGKSNVINITIRDSVIQRSSLIDLCSMDGTCPVNILVKDSVIQHSTFISERDERKEESLRKEREKQEKLRRQQEEEAERLEEIKRKAQQEELRRQREEAERKQKEKAEKKSKEKEAQERKQREEQEQKRREKEEEAQKEKKEEEKLRKHREEAERKIPLKKRSSSGKRVLVFSFIFCLLIISVAATLFNSNNHSENTTENETVAAEVDNNAQTDSSENSDTYTNSIGMEFVKIPEGEFMMGSSDGWNDDESPAHKVTIGEPFYLGKFEVTQKQWREVMGSNPSEFVGDNHPVECVSWEDAQEFLKKLNEMEGTDKYRLPSEAE